jgi:nucleotide-binding universal stress UspA family protein
MNNKIKTLVVGVDFSDYSKIVVSEARQLAKHLKSDVVYVFSYENENFYEEMMMADRVKVAQLYETKISRTYKVSDDERIVVRLGSAAKEIMSVAKKEKNPMIVVGHRGGHAFARFFLGSVAEKLASTTKFPLWIHRGNKVLLPKKVLVPSDLSKRSAKTISELSEFKKSFKSNLELYHVLEQPLPLLDYSAWTTVYKQMFESDTKKMEIFRKKYPALKVTRSQGDIISNIENHSDKFDIIAISPHEKPKDRMRFGRVTSKIVRSGDKPVLIVP